MCAHTSTEARSQPAGVLSLFHYMAMRDWTQFVKFISKAYLLSHLTSPKAVVLKDHEKNGPRKKKIFEVELLKRHELGNVSRPRSCGVLQVSTGVILFQLQWEANGWEAQAVQWCTSKSTVWQRRLDQRGREVWRLGSLWGEVPCICFILVGSREE